ncbi:hypothetical protein BOTBODRAFT_416420 [Botryobasidium botryosum FD-172 SS1]|uniref:MYND-type domain-containing protein n=1 Tax=Botryobasidium botryosum (strain FD-172 SS1) TaxID=930990 RepID=A0A067MA69_BOTB1|nr:hypothetical protein BOTBODRAFT_416420 [Botryobasidium botryosum FD-172 SS1]
MAITFNELSEDLLQLGKLDEAEKMLGKALRVRDDTSFGGMGAGPRMDAAVTRENFAQLREAQGRLADAKEIQCPRQMFKVAQLRVCSNCSCVFYCSAAYQKADWPRHKRPCRAFKSQA